MFINIQIVPFSAETPSWAKKVWLRAKSNQKENAVTHMCHVCEGRGKLIHEVCRKCNGKGEASFVEALRADISTDDRDVLQEVASLISTLSEVHIQRTIRLTEHGGGLTNRGSAHIVCGLKGEPLLAIAGRPKCNRDHAIFYAHAAMCVEYHHHRGVGSGEVKFIGIDREIDHNLGLSEKLLWTFSDEQYGFEDHRKNGEYRSLQIPIAAIEAAKQKSKCYHCRSTFYAVNGAQGVNGALTGAGAAFGGMPSPLKGPGIGY